MCTYLTNRFDHDRDCPDCFLEDYENTLFKEDKPNESKTEEGGATASVESTAVNDAESKAVTDSEAEIKPVDVSEVKAEPRKSIEEGAEVVAEQKKEADEKVKVTNSSNGQKVKSTASITLKHDLQFMQTYTDETNSQCIGQNSKSKIHEIIDSDTSFVCEQMLQSEYEDDYVHLTLKPSKESECEVRTSKTGKIKRQNTHERVSILRDPVTGRGTVAIEDNNDELIEDVLYDTPRQTFTDAGTLDSYEKAKRTNLTVKVNRVIV